MSHFHGRILGCVYTIFSQCQILTSCRVDHVPHSVVSNLIFALIYGIHLSYEWSFHLYPHIIYIYYFVASCPFLLWHSPNGVVLCCYQKKFSFSLKASLSQPCPSLLVEDFDYYYYYYLLIRAFHISVSWGSFTGVWVTASLPKSLGLFSVFWPFSIM